MGHYDTILNLLPFLTKDELLKLRSRVVFLAASTEPSGDEEMFYNMLNRIVEVANGRSEPHFKLFTKTVHYKLFRANFDVIHNYIDANFESAQKVDRLKLYHMFAEMLKDEISQYNIPLSLLTMIRNVPRIPSLVNAAYPGYSESGVLSMILKGIRNNIR
jgi:hypothetical protein